MRQRTLKPGFFTNEDLCAMEPMARLLFAGLLLIADRAGRFEDRPARIRATIFPYDTGVDTEKILSEIESRGFIRRYIVDGVRYGVIPKFEQHQHPHPKEPASVIPPPGKSNGESMKGNCETLSRPSFPSVPSGSSVPSESGSTDLATYVEPPIALPPGAGAYEVIDEANAYYAMKRGGPSRFIHELAPASREYSREVFLSGWRRFVDSKAGKPACAPSDFAANVKFWCEPFDGPILSENNRKAFTAIEQGVAAVFDRPSRAKEIR